MKTELVVSHLVLRLHHSSSDNADNDLTTVTKWNEAVLDSKVNAEKSEKQENRNQTCYSLLMVILKENV